MTQYSDEDTQALRTSLKASLDQAEWAWLLKHAERDAVILVSSELDLVEVGVCVAQDQAPAVDAWIAARQLAKPTRDQLETWKLEPSQRFLALVVAPYVLIQLIYN